MAAADVIMPSTSTTRPEMMRSLQSMRSMKSVRSMESMATDDEMTAAVPAAPLSPTAAAAAAAAMMMDDGEGEEPPSSKRRMMRRLSDQKKLSQRSLAASIVAGLEDHNIDCQDRDESLLRRMLVHVYNSTTAGTGDGDDQQDEDVAIRACGSFPCDDEFDDANDDDYDYTCTSQPLESTNKKIRKKFETMKSMHVPGWKSTYTELLIMKKQLRELWLQKFKEKRRIDQNIATTLMYNIIHKANALTKLILNELSELTKGTITTSADGRRSLLSRRRSRKLISSIVGSTKDIMGKRGSSSSSFGSNTNGNEDNSNKIVLDVSADYYNLNNDHYEGGCIVWLLARSHIVSYDAQIRGIEMGLISQSKHGCQQILQDTKKVLQYFPKSHRISTTRDKPMTRTPPRAIEIDLMSRIANYYYLYEVGSIKNGNSNSGNSNLTGTTDIRNSTALMYYRGCAAAFRLRQQTQNEEGVVIFESSSSMAQRQSFLESQPRWLLDTYDHAKKRINSITFNHVQNISQRSFFLSERELEEESCCLDSSNEGNNENKEQRGNISVDINIDVSKKNALRILNGCSPSAVSNCSTSPSRGGGGRHQQRRSSGNCRTIQISSSSSFSQEIDSLSRNNLIRRVAQ